VLDTVGNLSTMKLSPSSVVLAQSAEISFILTESAQLSPAGHAVYCIPYGAAWPNAHQGNYHASA
jgi:hypothetical protein